MKQLSICIPTYNRAQFLADQLNDIYEQIDRFGYKDLIEVIVSNNCSPDNTDEVVIPYIEKGLIYHKQKENIGPDNNFFTLFEMASGEYLWLLGDDDKFVDNVLEFLIKITENGSLDYIYLKTSGKANENSYKVVQLNKDELFERVSIMLSFMSSQVIRTSLIKKYMQEGKNKTENLMGYFYVFLLGLSNSNVCAYSMNKQIIPTVDNTGGYNFYKVWAKGVFDVLLLSEFGKSEKMFNLFKINMLNRVLLPITLKIRFLNTKNRFILEDESILKYYYSDKYSQFLFKNFLHSNKIIVYILFIIIKIYDKIKLRYFEII